MAQRLITLLLEDTVGVELKERKMFILITVIFTAFLIFCSILRFKVLSKYGIYDIDLRIFSESLQTTLNGQGFFFNEWEWEHWRAWSHFGTHNSPILFLLLPIYALIPNQYTLIVLQDLMVPLSALALFKFSRHILQNEKKALIISIAFLLNPITHGIVRYDFRPDVLAMPFMFLFAYYMARNDTKKSLLAVLFIISVKEDAGLFLIAYSMFELLSKRGFAVRTWIEEKRAVSFALLGLSWILISIFLIIPHFNTGHRYVYFMLYKPELSGRVFIFAVALAKLTVLFLSVAFVPLRRPAYWLPLVFLWSENAFANRLEQAMIGFQYDYQLLPMTFIVLVYALKEYESINPKRLLLTSIITALIFSPIVGVINAYPITLGISVWKYMQLFWG